MEDAELLREYVERGDQNAFGELVRRHIDLVYSAALRRMAGDRHRAEEVTQMVFTDLARKAKQLRNHPMLAAWLHQSTRWAAAGLRRAEVRRRKNETAAAEQMSPSPDAPCDWEQLRPILDEALDSLNEPDRKAVLLRFFSGQAYLEIGSQLGVNENTARMRVERALEKLQGLLARRGVTSTAAALSVVLTQNAVTAAPAGLATSTTAACMTSVVAGAGVGVIAPHYLMANIQLGLAGMLALGLAIGVVVQQHSNAAIEQRVLSIRNERTTRATELTGLREQLSQQEVRIHALDQQIATARELADPPLNPAQRERQRLDMIVRKGELDERYAALFVDLKLGPGELDQLKALLVDRNQAIYDAVAIAKEQGLPFLSTAEAAALKKPAVADIDVRIRNLLGAPKADSFFEYEELEPFRQILFDVLIRANLPDDLRYQQASAKWAKLLHASAPEHLDNLIQANGWYVPWPAKFVAEASRLDESFGKYLAQNEKESQARQRMFEIARDAALAGKIKLHPNSAPDYPVSRKEGPTKSVLSP
jgi:RNA polymerase sigma factor (sigma-70 family)